MLHALLLHALCWLPSFSPPTPVKVSFTLSGIDAGKGPVIVRFYNQPDYFLATVYAQHTLPASQATLTLMAELPAGTYAVAAFQDLDGNGELTMNWLRIPTEPLGFGNNFRPRLSKPAFADCALPVNTQHHAFTITLQ